jgi:predicted GNAT family acetyltransferase
MDTHASVDTPSPIDTRDNPSKQRYEARVDGELAGFAEYELGDGVITFVHTVVEDAYEGEGVGSSLARDALDAVRRDGELRVVAKCEFIKEWIERHPDYQDLLDER